jgi:hypothetical protein
MAVAAKKAKARAAQPVKEIQLLGPPPDVMAGEVVQPVEEPVENGQVVERPVENLFDAEQFVPVEKFGPPPGLYPEGAELFSYTPKAGDTIWFPLEFNQPTAVQVWEQYDLPWNVQTWEWMKWAGVPKSMQRKAVELLDNSQDEYLELFNQWMAATGRAPRGGSLLGK